MLEESPSLVPAVPNLLGIAYGDARRLAAAETDLPIETFPSLKVDLERAVEWAINGADFEL